MGWAESPGFSRGEEVKPSLRAAHPTPSASNIGQERSSRVDGPSLGGAALAPLG